MGKRRAVVVNGTRGLRVSLYARFTKPAYGAYLPRRRDMRDDDRKSSVGRRVGDERRSGVDTRSADEKRSVGERRSGVDRRAGIDRRSSGNAAARFANRRKP